MVELLIVLATATVLIRSVGSKTSDIVHAVKGTESERLKRWRQRHGKDFRPSGFSRYLDEAWADAAQRVADGRADRARRRAQYGYNPGMWALLRTWHAQWWSEQIEKAAERHGDRVAAGRRERGEDPSAGRGIIPEVNPAAPGSTSTRTQGPQEDHTIPEPPPGRPGPDFTPGPTVEAPGQPQGDSTEGGTGESTRTTTSNEDLLFAVVGMLSNQRRTEEHGPGAPASEPRQTQTSQGGTGDIIDAEIVDETPAPAALTELSDTEHDTNPEGDTMSGTVATQNTGGELGTVPRAQAFLTNFDTQLDKAASALEFAMNDLRSVGVTGGLLDLLGTVKENCVASRGLLTSAQAELVAHAQVGEAYRAAPGAGEKSYVTGE